MDRKTILIVVDGLGFQAASSCMGFLLGMVEAGRASLYRMECELPSVSRPLYECILTGTPPVESGIVHNNIVRNSHHESIFSLAKQAGKTGAAAAYHWVSELYNSAPYRPAFDRFTIDPAKTIPYGCFYHRDDYPDDHVFLDAEWLRQRYNPDFLLIHPMGIDHTGHLYGGESSQYRNAVRMIDAVISDFIPGWIHEGYQILVTADHGMNPDKNHGGNLPEEREIPLFVIGDGFTHRPDCEPKQTEICGNVCHLLNVQNHHKPVTPGFLTNL